MQEHLFHPVPQNVPTLCRLTSDIPASDRRYNPGTFRGGLSCGALLIVERDARDRYILQIPLTGELTLVTTPPSVEPVSTVTLSQLRYCFAGEDLEIARAAMPLLRLAAPGADIADIADTYWRAAMEGCALNVLSAVVQAIRAAVPKPTERLEPTADANLVPTERHLEPTPVEQPADANLVEPVESAKPVEPPKRRRR